MSQPWLRIARLSLHPPMKAGNPARYALVATSITGKGIPNAQVLLDGSLYGVHPSPTTEELLEAFDAAIRQHMLR